jgi:hypothetical protein
VLSASSATLTFATEAGGVYVVERVAKPLGGYTFAFLTGKANQDVKHLATANSLGIGK